MFKDTDTESQDLQYYIAVRQLGCEKVPRMVFELRKEIHDFLGSKDKLQLLLSDEEWIWKLPFAADITGHLKYLNLKLYWQKYIPTTLCTFRSIRSSWLM